MHAKSTPPAPTLDNLHTDILVLVLLQFKIDDPLYFIRLVKVCRKLRANLSGENAKKYWQIRLENDFPKIDSEQITDYKKVYFEQWQSRKRRVYLRVGGRVGESIEDINLKNLLNLVRRGNLAEISKSSASTFIDHWDLNLVDVLQIAKKNDQADVQQYVYQSMVNHFRHPDAKPDHHGRTQLHWAAICGMVDEISRLKTGVGGVHVQTLDGTTPLHFACLYDQYEVVKALLAAGANVNYLPKSKVTPILVAASHASIKVFEALIRAGADFEHQDTEGQTALFKASSSNNQEIVTALLALGAKFDHQAKDGGQPLFVASSKKVAQLLVSAGADLNYVTPSLMSALHAAAKNNAASVINFLISCGMAVNLTSKAGETPLFVAVMFGQEEAVDALIKAGGNVNTPNKKGETPLQTAAKCNYVAICKTLLAAGAHLGQVEPESLGKDQTIISLLKQRQLQQTKQNESLCAQILTLLEGSQSWLTTCTRFFYKPDLIKILSIQTTNLLLNNNVEHLTSLLEKYQTQIPEENYKFIMKYVLVKRINNEQNMELKKA